MTPTEHRRVQELFLRAVELDALTRRRWLDEQCGDDAALRTEVQRLLDHDDPRTLVSRGNREDTLPLPRQVQPFAPSLPTLIPPRGMMAIGALAVLIPVMICGFIADYVLSSFRDQLRADSLVQLVEAKSNAVRAWLSRDQVIVQSWADSAKLRQLIEELDAIAAKSSPETLADQLRGAPQQDSLNEEMVAMGGAAVRYAVWNRSLITLADWSPERTGVGLGVTPKGAQRLTEVLEGRAEAVMLGPDDAITRDYPGVPGKPRLGMLVPVRNEAGDINAVLLVYENGGDEELGRFIRLADSFQSDARGGTFIFNRDGLLLFDSPYDAQLRQLGLIPDEEGSFSAKRLELRDPGVDLTRGKVPPEPFAARPLTKMVRMARSGQAGVDVSGYRDVRGVMVAGAWQWLEEYQIGLGIEVDLNALQPSLWLAQLQFWAMIGLLALSLAMIAYSFFAIRKLRAQASTEGKIGPYALEQMVGEGGVGRVFRAKHELLKRPTAIKLLRPELVDLTTSARFQREAQLAAKLEHHNTVKVFDFGVSREGLLYLVMEWIDGETLDHLVLREGPMEPSRAAKILKQIAASLREAHSLGLIHRDLKPQNVMLTDQAGERDVVKVLDFGLARDITSLSTTAKTALGTIAGTPRYMAPERWQPMQPVNPAVDIFAFGCIAYWLLTAKEAVQGETLQEICEYVMSSEPKRPQAESPHAIPPWLDDLTVQCLARSPDHRPLSFIEVLERFPA